MKQAVAVVAVVLGIVGICLGAFAQSQVGAVSIVQAQHEAAMSQRLTALEGRLDADVARLQATVESQAKSSEAIEARLQQLQRAATEREAEHQLELNALKSQLNVLAQEVVRLRAAGARPAEVPKVPYIVNPRSALPLVVLWASAERTAKKGIAYVSKGTRCTLLESKELPRTRGGTMYKVRADSGEEGWIPHFCLEFRAK